MYDRRIGDGWGAASRRVVIGLVDAEVAGRLAQLFSDFSILPTLVFTCGQLIQEAREDSYGLIVLDAGFACEHDSRCLQQVREASAAPIIAVGDPASEDRDEVDVALDPRHDADEIARRGRDLLDLSRPVRLPHSLRLGSLELDVQRHQAW